MWKKLEKNHPPNSLSKPGVWKELEAWGNDGGIPLLETNQNYSVDRQAQHGLNCETWGKCSRGPSLSIEAQVRV